MRASAALVAFVSLAACGPSEADLARDRAALEQVMAADVKVAGELRKADGELAAGDRTTASETVKTKVIPHADANVTTAEALRPKTPWGKARAVDVTTLVRERRKSLDAYAAALAGDDGNALLAAIESQKLVEKRALSVWQGLASQEP